MTKSLFLHNTFFLGLMLKKLLKRKYSHLSKTMVCSYDQPSFIPLLFKTILPLTLQYLFCLFTVYQYYIGSIRFFNYQNSLAFCLTSPVILLRTSKMSLAAVLSFQLLSKLLCSQALCVITNLCTHAVLKQLSI